MPFSSFVSLLALAAAGVYGLPTAEPRASCAYRTFHISAPNSTAWNEKPYGLQIAAGNYGSQPEGYKMDLGADSTSSATTFTIDPSNGRLYAAPGVYAYWIGTNQGATAEVLFGNKTTISNMKASTGSYTPNIVKCQAPSAEGALLRCDADGSGTYQAWNTCWANEMALALEEGTADGPYSSPNPSPYGIPSCGSIKITATKLGCTSTSPA